MSRVLLVTQSTRSIGEFRRPWVRALYRKYVDRYRRVVASAAARLAPGSQVTLLAARGLVDESSLPAGVSVRYYDEESYKVDSRELAGLTRQFVSNWWLAPEREPSLLYRGVWLPDLLSVAKGILLRLEVVEPLGIIERVFGEVGPKEIVLLAGSSTPERLAGLLAESRGVPVRVAARHFLQAHAYGAAFRALFPREERLRLRAVLDYARRELVPTASPAGEGILFVTCRPRHHYLVDPLAMAVRSGGVQARVIAPPSREPEMDARLEALSRAGVPCQYHMDYLPRRDAVGLVRRYRPILRQVWRRIGDSPEFVARLTWKGVPLSKVARPFVRDSVERSLLAGLLFQEAAFRALDALQPSAVVITSNRRYAERAMALAARERRIPCLLFSGTLVPGRDQSSLFDIGDRILVIGDHLREALVTEEGVPPGRIAVVGDPRSNAARMVPRERLRQEVYTHFGLAPDRPLLVLVSKYVSLLFSVQEKEALYRTVLAATRRPGGPHVVVKVHPNEDLSLLRQQVSAWGWPDAILTQDYDIHRLFGAADAAIMVTSMAGIEAMAMGCPVVAVQKPGKDYEGEYMPPYVGEGVAERVDMGDPAALAETLGWLLSDTEARDALVERGRKFAARYIHPLEGRLVDRLLAIVAEVRSEIQGGNPGA